MASLTKAFNKDFFDSILPAYGENRTVNLPTWDEGQKMFLVSEYESAAGHRYYCGIRFCEHVVFVEKVGMYHNWTYLDSLELYAFNGEKLVLIQKRDYEKEFRNEAKIKSESESMICDYLTGQSKMSQSLVPASQIKEYAKSLVCGCYQSYLSKDYKTKLTNILPEIEQKSLNK